MTNNPLEEWANDIHWYFTHKPTKRYSAPLLTGKTQIKIIKGYNFLTKKLEKFVNIKYWPESGEKAIIVFLMIRF